jgi:hypothetical protein
LNLVGRNFTTIALAKLQEMKKRRNRGMTCSSHLEGVHARAVLVKVVHEKHGYVCMEN